MTLTSLKIPRDHTSNRALVFDADVRGNGDFDDPYECDVHNFRDEDGNPVTPTDEQARRADESITHDVIFDHLQSEG